MSSNVGISALITPDGRELQRTRFFTPEYLDGPVRLKTTLTPSVRWGPILQGTLVLAAIAVLLAAMLHNGCFAELNRRRSELAKRLGSAKGKSGNDPPGDDADGPPAHEVGQDTELDEDGPDSARQGPEKGDI